jgi:NTP pyrophosphatase (non-canonical NTP hydrolase)
VKLNEYQNLSKRTMPVADEKGIAGYALGMVCEAGEVGDIIKKEIFHGHPRNTEKIKDELGDALHYLSGVATMYGLTLEEVAGANLQKLMKRYPNGFSTEDSLKRVDAK